MNLPQEMFLPFFVYGALKPGLPAYESIRRFVIDEPDRVWVSGELFVRDGLPLLVLNGHSCVYGYLIYWQPGLENEAYQAVCDFEPRKHYEWKEIELPDTVRANVLAVRDRNRGNPQPLFSREWKLTGDPAFGEGLQVVFEVIAELERNSQWDIWQMFFRAQMAYLLLWSILERLSALCFGPAHDPMQRVKRLHQLSGMDGLVSTYVCRQDRVSDSRDPRDTYQLDASNPKKCFEYYYQVRSNLSHRGKAVHNEVDKVVKSLSELASITKAYLQSLNGTGEPF